jgi:hypothetical protein
MHPSGTVDGMGDKGDMRIRAIAQLALAVDTGGDVKQAVQAAHMAEGKPREITELRTSAAARQVLEGT